MNLERREVEQQEHIQQAIAEQILEALYRYDSGECESTETLTAVENMFRLSTRLKLNEDSIKAIMRERSGMKPRWYDE